MPLSEILELTAVAIWCFVVAVAGGSVGLVLGNIRLPVVLLAAVSPAAGAGANIAISGIAAGTASLAHLRAGRVHWPLFWVMAIPSAVGAVVGGIVSGALPDTVLLAAIGVTLLGFGIDLLRRPPVSPAGHVQPGKLDYRAAALAGATIGLLGGLVGLILGALRLPALLRLVGAAAPVAIGTNALVGVVVGVAGLVGHLPAGVDWTLLAVGGAASIPGALLGAKLTGRLSQHALLRTIAVILVVAGLSLLIQAAV